MTEPIPDFRTAVAWLGEHLDTEQAPVRLHDRDVGDDGAPRLAARFIAWLDCRPFDVVKYDGVLLGEYQDGAWRYRRPMRAALEKLRLRPGRAWPERQPAPYVVLRILFLYEFDGPAAALHMGIGWDRYEALVVMAARMLRGRYQLAPSSGPGWVSKSESQQNAEDAA